MTCTRPGIGHREPPRVTATKSSDASEPYLRRLKEFIALLLDPAVLDAIASDLRSGRTYDELTKYVAENFLGDYTLTHELHRMEYVVVTADGAELTTPDAIRDHAKANPAVLRDVLLQMANQSLLWPRRSPTYRWSTSPTRAWATTSPAG